MHVTSPEHLQQWWWAGIMGAAANAVQQLRASVPRHQPVPAEAVKGLSLRHYRMLDRSPLDSVDHTILIEECRHAMISLVSIDLGEGQQTIVRGICTGDYIPCASGEADGDEDYYYSSQAHRLVLVTWGAATDSHVLNRTSIHYINKFDMSKRWFLFQEDVVVSYPNRAQLSLSVIFGPWAGHGCRLFDQD